MVFQGQRDTIVPPSMARTLYSLAPEPKVFHLVAGAGHNDVCLVGGKAYWNAWRRFLSDVGKGKIAGSLR
jgi:fermentation-respiration switch protein FrsA (DUF1100 family)